MELVRLIKAGSIEALRASLNLHKHDVNERIERVGGLPVDGPIVVLAIDLGNLEILELLVRSFGANINQEIIWCQSNSSILIYAMARAVETNNFSVFEKLLSFDSNLNRTGWIRLDNYHDFGTPMSIANGLKDTDFSEKGHKLTEIMINHVSSNWKGLSIEELRRDIMESKRQIKIQTQILNVKTAIISQRLTKSKSLEAEINECESAPGYLTEEEIALEAKSNRERLAEPRRILRAIQEIKVAPGYLEPGHLFVLENQVKFQSSEYSSSHLECQICMEIPQATFGSKPKVFCCNSGHILCERCLARIAVCPTCQQRFETEPPKRNEEKEYEIEKFQENKRKEEEEEAFSRDLPSEIAQEFVKILKSKQKAKKSFKKLEGKVSHARQLQEQIKCLEAMSNHKSMEEVDMIQMKSDAKISEARKLNQKIAAIKMNPEFLSKDQRRMYKELADCKNF